MTTFALPATVAAKAQGIEFTVDPSTFHADTLEKIFEYGARRWFQDSINAQAHQFRNDEESQGKFDAQAAIDAKIAQAVSGDISTRGSGTGDPLDTYRVQVLRKQIDPKGANGKALDKLETSGAQVKYILSLYAEKLSESQRAAVDKSAKALKALADERRDALRNVSSGIAL